MTDDMPEAPTGVRLIYPDGRILPIELTYTDTDADGIRQWTSDVVPEPGCRVEVDVLPPMTSVSLPFAVDPVLAPYLPNVGRMIRSNNPFAYRRYEWALIRSVVKIRPPSGRADDLRPVYRVQWPDGAADVWAVEDPPAAYEFRDTGPADLARCVTRHDCPAVFHHDDCPKGRTGG